jgi:hypothetical protein
MRLRELGIDPNSVKYNSRQICWDKMDIYLEQFCQATEISHFIENHTLEFFTLDFITNKTAHGLFVLQRCLVNRIRKIYFDNIEIPAMARVAGYAEIYMDRNFVGQDFQSMSMVYYVAIDMETLYLTSVSPDSISLRRLLALYLGKIFLNSSA